LEPGHENFVGLPRYAKGVATPRGGE
jgi:hypothetical protein